eukprot:TRINITY_DN90_c0_g2_i3.p1 TRINITY_DN90_c0_g2~~TRINITY_DN90_c0_g2_i3.p1  ORF type:complete len:335 (+),score=54.50 TRINITY_DN90_c0_g2_i3:61-1005(+)
MALLLWIVVVAALAAVAFYLYESKNVHRVPLSTSTYGSWVIVTGASSGLGEQFAQYFASRGFNVILVARREELLSDLSKRLETQFKISTKVVAVDISREEGVDKLVSETQSLDVGILINNAGFGYTGALIEQDANRLVDLVQLNCISPMLLISRIAPKMKAKSKGAIINVSSASACQPLPYHAAYAASKSFLSSLSMALYEELKGHGIDVLVIEPGTISDTAFRNTSGATPSAKHSSDATTSEVVVRDTIRALELRRVSNASLTSPVVIPGSNVVRVRSRIASALMALGGDVSRRFVLRLAAKRNLRLLTTSNK